MIFLPQTASRQFFTWEKKQNIRFPRNSQLFNSLNAFLADSSLKNINNLKFKFENQYIQIKY